MYVNIIDTKYILFFCQITTLLIDCVAFSFGLGINKNDYFERFKGK